MLETTAVDAMDGVAPARAQPMLLGESPQARALRARLPAIASAQRTTLISGPTGSGKDLVAHSLHELSPRRARPLVTVHCAALPEALVEAEMFGHSRGAFTGASQARHGLIRSASDGTLFLDEIDSLPLAAQAKLLRFLETGEYRPVGSDRVEQSLAWVIAATNQDLSKRVREGGFRADLLFRLQVVRLTIPPLCERKEDVLPLAEHFLAGLTGGARQFTDGARAALAAYAWPGNIRELRHRVESAVILDSSGPTIGADALQLETASGSSSGAPGPGGEPSLQDLLWRLVASEGLSLAQAIEKCERLLLDAALRAEEHSRSRAAGRLRVHVRTVFKKLRKFDAQLGTLGPIDHAPTTIPREHLLDRRWG